MSRQQLKCSAGQSVDEMTQQLEGTGHSRLYNPGKGYPSESAAVKREATQRMIQQQKEMLQLLKARGRVNLDDLQEVTITAEKYMQSCERCGIYPNMLGFSAACGLSRATLYRYLSEKNTPTSQYLEGLRTSWAAILLQAGLSRNASEAMSIFLLKNSSQGYSDNAGLEIIPPRDEREELDQKAAEIMRKYQDLPD